jgi:hypothetical protein
MNSTLQRLGIKVFKETPMTNSSWLVIAIRTALQQINVPSLEDIAREMAHIHACQYFQHIPRPKLETVFCYILKNFTRFCCSDVSLVYRYLEADLELPSLDTLKKLNTHNRQQLQLLVNRLLEIGVNIDEECVTTGVAPPGWIWVLQTADSLRKTNPLFTIQHLAQEMLKRLSIISSRVSLETQEIILCHILKTFSRIKLDDMYYIATYYTSAGQELPTQEMLHDTMQQHEELMRAPHAYCEKSRVTVPTPNLEYLMAVQPKHREIQENMSCAICQKDILKTHWVYKLPGCGHTFHARGRNCLGGDDSQEYTVRNWLQTSKYCPLCRAEVSIPSTDRRKSPRKRKRCNKGETPFTPRI